MCQERAVVMTVHAGDDYTGLVLVTSYDSSEASSPDSLSQDQEPEYLSILVSGEMEVLRNRDWNPSDAVGSPGAALDTSCSHRSSSSDLCSAQV